MTVTIAAGMAIIVAFGIGVQFCIRIFDRARACAGDKGQGGAREVQRQLVRGEEGQEDLCRLRLEKGV